MLVSLLKSLWLGRVCDEVQNKKKSVGLTWDSAPVISSAKHVMLYVVGDESTGLFVHSS
jgi:hypothetical protein